MALMACPNCGMEISEEAMICNNCGYNFHVAKLSHYNSEIGQTEEDISGKYRRMSTSLLGTIISIPFVLLFINLYFFQRSFHFFLVVVVLVELIIYIEKERINTAGILLPEDVKAMYASWAKVFFIIAISTLVLAWILTLVDANHEVTGPWWGKPSNRAMFESFMVASLEISLIYLLNAANLHFSKPLLASDRRSMLISEAAIVLFSLGITMLIGIVFFGLALCISPFPTSSLP